MSGVRPVPVWFIIILVVELLLALALAALVVVVWLAFQSQPTPRDIGVMVGFAALPVILVGGAAALAWWLWRSGNTTAAGIVAALPLLIALPILLMLFGAAF